MLYLLLLTRSLQKQDIISLFHIHNFLKIRRRKRVTDYILKLSVGIFSLLDVCEFPIVRSICITRLIRLYIKTKIPDEVL